MTKGVLSPHHLFQAKIEAERLGTRIVDAIPGGFKESNGQPCPNITRFALADGRHMAVLQTGPRYYVDKNGLFRPVEEIAIHAGNTRPVLDLKRTNERCSLAHLRWWQSRQALFPNGKLSFGIRDGHYWGVKPSDLMAAASYTGNPDADPESASVDGYARKGAGTWYSARSASTAEVVNSSGSVLEIEQVNNSPTFRCGRAVCGFDTSAIGASPAISAATLKMDVTSAESLVDDKDDQAYLAIVEASLASNTAVAAGDYDTLIGDTLDDPTRLAADVDQTAMSFGAGYETWTLNSTGFNYIDGAGITNFAVREGHDVEGLSPNSHSDGNYFEIRSADAGSGNIPLLSITYTAAAGYAFGIIIGA